MAFPAFAPGSVHAQQSPTTLPPVRIEAPQNRSAPKRAASTTAAKRRTTRVTPSQRQQPQTASAADDGNGPNNSNSGPPLQQVPELGKTGTPLADLPGSVQIIPRQVLTEQGTTTLKDAVTNASGINTGGQDSLGYFDHFLIRGLNAQVYSDGFSDGDQLGGLSHSLNGVRRIEILEGPGSALFGSGPPGGTINIVHYEPSPVFHFGSSVQADRTAPSPTAITSPDRRRSTGSTTGSTPRSRAPTVSATSATRTMKSGRNSCGTAATIP